MLRRGNLQDSLLLLLFVLALTSAGCGGCADEDTGSEPPTPDAGEDAGDDAARDTGQQDVGEDIQQDSPEPDADASGDPCDPNPCARGEVCEEDENGEAACRFATCDDLACSDTEACDTLDTGGAECIDISCGDDIDCPAQEFCNGAICVADLCDPGVRRCEGNTVFACDANGGGEMPLFTCQGLGNFASQCVTNLNEAYCTCLDDWDCPNNTACESGRCEGTGVAPTCFLPPQPFEEVLPAPEIIWGGEFDDRPVATSSFPDSSQVVISPIVANLDDDNADGFINELDFPEILFMTFCNSAYTENGILRAIHGGGPNKGQDYFATRNTTTWHEGDDLITNTNCNNANLDATSSLAVGDLDGDGRPEILGWHENNGVIIYDNTGEVVSENFINSMNAGGNPAISVANLDRSGLAEVIVGNDVLTLEKVGDVIQAVDRFRGREGEGANGQGAISCVADITGGDELEVIGGGTVYRLPPAPAGATRQADCTTNGGTIAPTTADEMEFCNGRMLTVWDAGDVNGNNDYQDGFCAIADILGADQDAPPGPNNPLDGVPEVIVIDQGFLRIFNNDTGELLRNINAEQGGRGGAPNVDDFDGDGFPEVGSAFEFAYVMIDLQEPTANCPVWPETLVDDADPPTGNETRNPGGPSCASDAECTAGEATCNPQIGQCVCYYNGWVRQTEDDSSRVTGSTLFDFNGDGAAEVIYNDECWFRIYNGVDGEVLFKEASESRTRIEYPIVADVDNDGNAEIVFGVSNESGYCDEPGPWTNTYNNGLEVWGDPSDTWVSARRVWNQHSYHVTNVLESGAIPMSEVDSWADLGGRQYNTYRSQPRNFGVAPDLTITGIQLVSPDVACGGGLSDQLTINVEIRNAGDLRVGPGVVVGFYGIWDGAPRQALRDGANGPITFTLQNSLEPGRVNRVSVDYDATANGDNPDRVPDEVVVVVDAEGDPVFGSERECREDNNESTVSVEAGEAFADLVLLDVDVDPGECPDADLMATIRNDGSVTARDIIVRFYAGNPEAGGEAIDQIVVPGPLAQGQTETVVLSTESYPGGRDIVVHAIVDPDNLIAECNDGDNAAADDMPVRCQIN